MKKVSILWFVILFVLSVDGFAQTVPPTDFFAGKWEISLTGTPRGDVKFMTDLVRKEGKLTGELVDAADPANGKRAITKVDEQDNGMVIHFKSSQGEDTSIDLTKVDDDNLKGTLMGFSATAKRLK